MWIINGPVGPFSVAGVLASFDILGGRGGRKSEKARGEFGPLLNKAWGNLRF